MLRLCLSSAMLFVIVAACGAEEKTAVKKPVGTWTREAGSHKLTMKFTENALVFTMKDGDGNTIVANSDYGITKEGTVFGILTKVEKTGNGPEKGELFSFSLKVKGNELTVSELTGTHVNEDSRKIVEGTYKSTK